MWEIKEGYVKKKRKKKYIRNPAKALKVPNASLTLTN